LKRRSGTPPNNYTNYFALVDALTNRTSATYDANVESVIDVEQWARTLATERIMGNHDSFSWSINGVFPWAAHNLYAYKPQNGKWKLMMWDLDYSFSENPANNLLTGKFNGDTEIEFLSQRPMFQRAYLRALQDAVNGPLLSANFTPYLMSNFFTLSVSNGMGQSEVHPTTGQYTNESGQIQNYPWGGPISFLNTRRSTIQSLHLNPTASTTFAVNPPPSPSGNVVTLTGTAPLSVTTIRVNGIDYPVTWTSQTAWSIQVILATGANGLLVEGYNSQGTWVGSGFVSATGPATDLPENSLVINEIMHNPLVPGAEFVEIYNRSTTTTFSLANYRLRGLDFTFPSAQRIAPNSYLILAKSRTTFGETYGYHIPVAGEFANGTLQPTGEKLTLLSPNGATIDVVVYDDSAPWPTIASGSGISLQLIDPTQDNRRACNWATNAVRATPGALNAGQTTLPAFAALWVNEVQPTNQTGVVDNMGDREPWLELYNAGATTLPLTGYYLTDTYSDLTRWAFPAGATIGAGQFIIIWLDGETNETAGTNIHTSFKLSNAPSGSIILVTNIGGQNKAFDFLNYTGVGVDQSYGSLRHDKPEDRGSLMRASPRATNAPVLWINEWMANNNAGFGGRTEDWFEIYNPNPNEVNIRDYQFRDSGSPVNAVVQDVIIPAGGYLHVWADDAGANSGTLDANGDLRLNFKLSPGGDSIALTNLFGVGIDSIIGFAPQVADQSHGRLPDGSATIAVMEPPTPRAANNLAPAINIVQPTNNQIFHAPVDITIVANASDSGGSVARVDFYTNGVLSGAVESAPFLCTMFNSAPGNYALTAVATDDLGLSRTSAVVNIFVNSRPTISAINNQTMNEDSNLVIPFTIGDLETPVNSLAVSATSFNTALIPNANLVLGGSGANRTLSITPAPNEFSSGPYGGAIILLAVTDGHGFTQGTTFEVTVNPVNDRPTINPIAARTMLQYSGTQVISLSGIGSGAANESQTLTVTASSSNPSVIPNPTVSYTSPQNTGSLTITPSSAETGSAIITVTVQDNGGTANGGVDTYSIQFTIVLGKFGLDVDFGFTNVSPKVGFAAIGFTTNDFWNGFAAVGSYSASMPNVKLMDGNVSSVGLQLQNTRFPYYSSSTDPMFHTYVFSYEGPITVTVTNLPVGHYDLYLYGHGDANVQNSTFEVVSGLNYGSHATTKDADWYFSDWIENRQYVLVRFVYVTNTQPLIITIPFSSDGFAVINGMQIVSAAKRLINVDFAGGPVSPKIGFAAVGATTNDFWNSYGAPGQWGTPGLLTDSLPNLKLTDRRDTDVGLVLTNARFPYTSIATDPMYHTYVFSYEGTISAVVTNLPTGNYDFYLYGHGDANDQNSTFTLVSGSTSYGTQATTTSSDWSSSAWAAGRQYVVFTNVAVTAGQAVSITVPLGSSGYAIINGMQIVPKTTAIPPSIGPGFSLVNLDFLNSQTSAKTGQAAVGINSNDFWNAYATVGNSSDVLFNLRLSDKRATKIIALITNALYFSTIGVSDPMYNTYSYVYGWDADYIGVTVSNLQAGLYDFYIYAHGEYNELNGLIELQSDKHYGMQATTTTTNWMSPTWAEWRQLVLFRNIRVQTNGQPVRIKSHYTWYYYVAPINGIQIVAKAAPIPGSIVITNNMINVDFGFTNVSPEVGFAAIGATRTDFWNGFGAVGNYTDSLPSLKFRNGTTSSIGLTMSNTRFPYSNGGLEDKMYDSYVFSYEGTITVNITNLPTANYDLYLYGHGGAENQNSAFTVVSAGNNYGTNSTTTALDWWFPDWIQGRQYVVFSNVAATNGQPVTITVPLGPSGYAVINGMQIIFK